MMSLPQRPEGRRPRTKSPLIKEGAPETRPLDRAPRHCMVEIVEVEGGANASRQLAQLGIVVGALLQIKRAAPLGGPVLVEIRGSTVAVGRGVARQVFVRTVQ